MESVFQILMESWEQHAKEAAASPSEGGCEAELSLSMAVLPSLLVRPYGGIATPHRGIATSAFH